MALIQATHAYHIIYVYSSDDADHQGIVKIGKATVHVAPQRFEQLTPNCEALVNAANERIHEQTGTFGASHQLLYTELAHIKTNEGEELQFCDTDVHQVLLNSGYTRHRFPKLGDRQPQEWFDIAPGEIDIVKQAITAVKEGRNRIAGLASGREPREIAFRTEQLEAIRMTVAHFARPGKMLWNAKMRFGKTLCALETVRRLGYRRTLILTHRPSVKSGWFDDFRLIKFEDYSYGSKPSDNSKNGQPQVGETFDVLQKSGRPFVYFASMQDLRGSWDKADRSMKKNADIFSTPWDLVIIDEAHEGTKTALGQSVIHALKKKSKHFLYLSGTPYNILSAFKDDEIYTWDYVNEQDAKARWADPSRPNPYEGLARLNIRTYNLGSVFDHYNHSDEDYFEFSEFFRTWTGDERQDGGPLPEGIQVGRFVHESDVRSFLRLLHEPSPESYYPFSREEYKAYFAHTFWVVPGVREAAALSRLLQEEEFFKAFYVVNVAGEGDKIERLSDTDDAVKIEKQERDCVKKVKDAISTHERTITLSCGRLTTGVSIEEWTAVFLLAGSYTTKAAGYLQTIFRAQTPFKHTPGIKTDCYAFDFAPDRTLTVIDEYIKTQQRTSNACNSKQLPLTTESFLRYCSIIAIDGGRTVDYDAVKFMQQVNHVYTEHVVQKGFRDGRLYTGLFSVGEADLEWISEIGRIVGEKASASKRDDGKIVVTKEGLDGGDADSGRKKGSPSAKKHADDEAATPSLRPKRSATEVARSTLRKVLDLVSVRLPMMIFGAVESVASLTLAKFVEEIDADSWREFMPSDFTKAHFHRLLAFYNNDVFISSALHIVSQAKEIDRLPLTERVREMAELISTFHYPDKETVLTPWRVVNKHMALTLGGYVFYDEAYQKALSEPRFVSQGEITERVFGRADTRILEINSKSGVYPLWLAYTLFRLQKERGMLAGTLTNDADRDSQLWKHVVERHLFIICQTPMAERITRRVLIGYRDDVHPNTKCFPDLVGILRAKEKGQERYKKLISNILKPSSYGGLTDMKKLVFSAVVGNPPYQMESNKSTRKPPIYNYFYDLAFDLSNITTLITPGRFLFKAGQTPKDWMNKMLRDDHFKVIDYYPNTADVFPSVDIKGGVVISFRNAEKSFGAIGVFSPFKELRSILKKVKDASFLSFSPLVSSRGMYKFTEDMFKDFPQASDIQKDGSGLQITSNAFDNMPFVFLEDGNQSESYKIIGRTNNTRVFRWIKKKYVQPNDYLGAWNVLVPEANGSGSIGEVLSTPIIGSPIIGHTDTFLSIGKFSDESEALACMKYIKTRFARTLLGTLKATQHNPRSTWKNVPLQDFTSKSDIDWTRSIAEIDRQLYTKYGLSNEEICFIEEKVQAME